MPTGVQAAERKIDFEIPLGPLSGAITAFGQQADMTIGVSDPLLASVRTRGVRGHLTIPSALARMLAHMSFTFVLVSDGAGRIQRTAPVAPRDRQRPMRKASEPVTTSLGDIVVTTSKQSTSLDHFAGAALRNPTTDAASDHYPIWAEFSF